MSLNTNLQLSRDSGVTVANLLDELLRRKGDCEVTVAESGPYRLSELHADVCRIDAFLRPPSASAPASSSPSIAPTIATASTGSSPSSAPGASQFRSIRILSLAEVRRILADSGTDILVTDKAVFERTILSRDALNVRTWIQADEESQTLDGFLRPTAAQHIVPAHRHRSRGHHRRLPHLRHQRISQGRCALQSNALLGARASTVLAGFFLGPKDLALIALPWSHIMAVSIALYGLMAGIRGCFLDHFDVASALDLVERHGITAFVGVPAMFARLVNSNPPPVRLRTIRLWLSASDHLPAETRQRLRQFGALVRLPFGGRIPSLILNGYGMVELGGLAMMGIDLSLLPGSGDLYFPVPPFHIRVVDEDGAPVPTGVTGECQIRRRGLAPHYWKHEEGKLLTPDLLTPDGWLRTGDLATRNPLGLIRLVGRMKDVIKSGGYSVYVRELEEALLAHPAVARAVAFGLPHKEKGERPAAAVELRDGSSATEQELLDWGRQHLAGYKAPRRIWIFAPGTLPQNHTGKVLRRELRERFSAEMNEAGMS